MQIPALEPIPRRSARGCYRQNPLPPARNRLDGAPRFPAASITLFTDIYGVPTSRVVDLCARPIRGDQRRALTQVAPQLTSLRYDGADLRNL